MHVNVSCPDCSRQLRLPQDVMGQSVRCPLCKTVFEAREPGASKLPLRATEDDALPLLPLADDDPPREERRGSRGRDRDDRPRRPARDRDPADRRPARRPSATRGFAMFIHRDPHDKFQGEFKAEIDEEGLTFWRGRGREILVPLGSAVEYLGNARLLLEVEGRKLELTTVHRDGMHDELAREVMEVLGNRDEPFRMPTKPRGKVVWTALLPMVLPLLAWAFGDDIAGLGGVLTFSILGAVLTGIALAFTMQRSMETANRAWTALGLTLGGLLVLGISLRVDHSGPAEPPVNFSHWIAFAPLDSGFSAEFPGLPEIANNVANIQFNSRLTNSFSLEMGGKTHLVAGYGFAGNAAGEIASGQVILSGVRVTSQRQIDLDKIRGVEVRFETNDGRSGIARYFVKEERLFGISFVSRRLSPTSRDAQKFLDSLAFDTSTGWPGPGTSGLKPIAAVTPNLPGMANLPGMPNNPGIPNLPGLPIPALDLNRPGTNLGLGGTLLLAHQRDIVWTGYRAKTNDVVGVGEDGLVHLCDETGQRTRQTKLELGENVSGAALSSNGKTLAVLGISGKLVLLDLDDLRRTNVNSDTIGGIAQWNAAFSPDGKFLATTHGDAKVRIWAVDKSAVVKRFPVGKDQVLSVAFSHDGKELICGDMSRTLYHLDSGDGRILAKRLGHEEAQAPWDGPRTPEWRLRALAMADDGTILSGSNDRSARFWKLPLQNAKKRFNHKSEVTAVAFHPAGRLALSAEANGWVHLFETATLQERPGLVRTRFAAAQYNGWIRAVAYNATSNKILVADGSRLECWDLIFKSPLRPQDRLPVTPRAPSGPSELQDRGKLVEHQFALICPEKQCALLFTADRKVHRYTYPAWKLTKSAPFPIAVRSGAIDAAKGILYAVEGTGDRPVIKRDNDILVYDFADLLDDKALPAPLEPRSKIKSGFNPRDLFLDASGKSLYYVEGVITKLLVRRLDTAALDTPETLLDQKRYFQLIGSPDRKSLFVFGSDVGQRNPVVVRFEAETGKKGKELAIPSNYGLALHAGADLLLLRGRDGQARLDWRTSQITTLSSNRNDPGAWIDPKGMRLYIEGFDPHVLNAYDVPAAARALPAPAFTMELTEPVRMAAQRGPTFTPDGKFLLYPSGRLIGLGKDVKPVEPAPEP